ncbi:MAG: sugar phosphate isomerase/epimerase, partial [Verrucomicrobia bacterium]|nr:sugar phosphate isomerase/epimerase [Verrucomicrobiota bacterium]
MKHIYSAAQPSDIPERIGPFGPLSSLSRRQVIKTTLAAASAAVIGADIAVAQRTEPGSEPDERRSALRRYSMKKSINLWAFPYPDRMTLRECLQLAKDAGFEGIELNYDLENDLSPKSGSREYFEIRKMADDIGIEISGLCSFLFWPYPLTSNDVTKRERGMELAGLMAQAAHDLGVENLLVVPGAVHIPWRDDHEPVRNDICDKRAREAIGKLVPQAEKLGVYLNIEN